MPGVQADSNATVLPLFNIKIWYILGPRQGLFISFSQKTGSSVKQCWQNSVWVVRDNRLYSNITEPAFSISYRGYTLQWLIFCIMIIKYYFTWNQPSKHLEVRSKKIYPAIWVPSSIGPMGFIIKWFPWGVNLYIWWNCWKYRANWGKYRIS